MAAIFFRFLFLANAASVLFAEEGGGESSGKKDPLGDIPGFGDKPCPLFRCSTGQVPVPKERRKYTSLGCSAMGGGMMMTPGIHNGEKDKFAPCCDLWHTCYQICGSPKRVCDETFKTCSEKACGTDEQCTKNAEMKGMMMKFGGCEKYNKLQFQGCDCIPKADAEDKRSEALKYFYRKHAPNGNASPQDLAKKADSTAKMASLMRKLIAKYPKSIKIEVDPQQEMMEKMMRDSREKKEQETVHVEDVVKENNMDDSDEKIEL